MLLKCQAFLLYLQLFRFLHRLGISQRKFGPEPIVDVYFNEVELGSGRFPAIRD